MVSMPRKLSLWISALLFSACAPPQLIPIGSQGRHRGSAVAQAGGVTLVATANAWRYGSDVTDIATPLHIFLLNDSAASFSIGYDSFSLIDETGRVHAALPPAELLRALYSDQAQSPSTPGALAGGGEGASLAAPDSSATPPPAPGLGLPPTYGPTYGIDPWAGPYPGPYVDAMGGWGFGYGVPYEGYRPLLGTRAILQQGLRPGRLPPGTRVEGFVFFQPVWKDHLVKLHFDASPEHGSPIALRLRFEVHP